MPPSTTVVPAPASRRETTGRCAVGQDLRCNGDGGSVIPVEYEQVDSVVS